MGGRDTNVGQDGNIYIYIYIQIPKWQITLDKKGATS